MLSCSLPVLFLVLLPLAAPINGALQKTHGVSPALLPKYVPVKASSGAGEQWQCLDGSQHIPWNAVNDDYCDCSDGSDEPGTSACPNTTFHCVNAGHIGADIRSSRVNDGLCEHECCDGSDEQPGVCPNQCKEIGEAYRQKVEAELKIRKTGAKIRSTYVSFAQKEKTRLEALVASTTQEIAEREIEVARLKVMMEKSESTSAAEMEFKKGSPLYTSLITHSNALKSLQREHLRLKEKEKTLADILASLRTGYNPNYQDMAVLEAVRGYEYYASLPHIGHEENEEGSDGDEDGAGEVGSDNTQEELGEGMWSKEKLENELDLLLTTDHENLLLEHEHYMGATEGASLLLDIGAYIPDTLVPHYIALKDIFSPWLQKLGIVRASHDAAEVSSQARSAFNDAEDRLRTTKRSHEDAKVELSQLFDPDWFGAEGEWKKLMNTCLSKDTGEYTYEVCLFGEAKQIPNKGGSNFSLGKFATWHPSPDVKIGTPEYYTKQTYTRGARCWNGPERSVTLILSCGTENIIHSVAEPEKCEYHLTGTTPALCLPIPKAGGTNHQEL